MEIEVKVIDILAKVGGTSQSTGKNWSKQEFVGETQDKYPSKICFGLLGDERIEKNLPHVGEVVKVHFDVSSREYNGKWYSEVLAYRVTRPNATSEPSVQLPPTGAVDLTPFGGNEQADNGKLPF